ncbi:MAG: alpha-amylase family glycosyl hydrolase, partial [Candidatus Nanopelagicaceae bacterium]
MSSTLAPRGVRPWWRDAVTYQIYIRSFADSNGDGIGDVEGIRSKLGYLQKLGVDAIWITPWYPSPQNDHGYDVSDYMNIEPDYGTLKDAERLIKDAHEHGIKVIVDIVPNHTSDQHKWFQAALKSKPGSPERARYIFREGKGPNGDLPPNNWQAVFGGPAWHRVVEADGKMGQWYLHLFAVEQPDLNWENPEVRGHFEDVLKFWLDRGVDGFRIDVAHGMFKEKGLPDIRESWISKILGRNNFTRMLSPEHKPFWDQEGVHDIYRSWRKI